MGDVERSSEDIVVAGWSCRLPGAGTVQELWSVLVGQRCTVSSIPPDRWPLERFAHPSRQHRGRSYTWAAGVLERMWDFDPVPFSIAPREAGQMDPQQRILLELTWEALEDAGVVPSSLAGTNVGVYVGGSSTDYAKLRASDPSGGDAYFATGNALSILANRISHVFDLRGPSLTIDTACSSSLVALHHAVEALRGGRIDTAIVGGINILSSPFSFISFSQASMLSPTGRCRAFSADADGYVRAEGGVVLVLRRAKATRGEAAAHHGVIVATDVNSDGRTPGIALPSGESQQELLTRIYASADIQAADVAFIEAHGTGTPAGDPIEAGAIGHALGQRRTAPLPIGSVKANIGHLEPVAGLVGVVKALLSLKAGLLPPSLHFSEPNPNIDFSGLNLRVAANAIELPAASRHHQTVAGVNSFGFGGTNAHAIVSVEPVASPVAHGCTLSQAAALFLSAATPAALAALASRYAELVAGSSEAEFDRMARAAAHRRERLPHRLIVTEREPSTAARVLEAFGAGRTHPHAIAGHAPSSDLRIAFVYSGNGSQFVGMGQRAYRESADFRTSFDRVDAYFSPLAGWSLAKALLDNNLAAHLSKTSTAQPLIFAIQVATTRALATRGIRPDVVLGHSVGEVAAAFAAGALDLESAVRVIHFRSLHQELTAGAGDMVALLAPEGIAAEIAAGLQGLQIAAFNGPAAVTVAGPRAALDQLSQRAAARNLRVIELSLGYPLHTALMAETEQPLRADLADIRPRQETTTFVSTVTGNSLSGSSLNATYWWRNVREPVRFDKAVVTASSLGAGLFVEIGPRATVTRHVRDCLADIAPAARSLAAFDPRSDASEGPDPITAATAKIIVNGAAFDAEAVFGPNPSDRVELPLYPWQHREYRFEPTVEALGCRTGAWHPLCGDRDRAGGIEWHASLDTQLLPELAEHVVSGQVILPGSAFVEIALAVGQQWLESSDIIVSDLAILKPLALPANETREILTRVAPGSNTFEILSRPRLSTADWLLHARGKLYVRPTREVDKTQTAPTFDARARSGAANSNSASSIDQRHITRAELYALAQLCGLDYGPAFRLVNRVERKGARRIQVELDESRVPREYLLDPTLLDACFHGLFVLFPELGGEHKGSAFIPIRFDEIALHCAGFAPSAAQIEIRRAGPRTVLADFHLLSSDGSVIARLTGARFAAVATRRRIGLEQTAVVERLRPLPDPTRRLAPTTPGTARGMLDILGNEATAAFANKTGDGKLLLEGWAAAAAIELARALARDEVLDVSELVTTERIPSGLRDWLSRVLRRLQAAGLTEKSRKRAAWQLLPDPDLPSAAEILTELLNCQPEYAPEIHVAADVGALVKRFVDDGAIAAGAIADHSSVSKDYFDLAGSDVSTAAELLVRSLSRAGVLADGSEVSNVLVLGDPRLIHHLASSPGCSRLKLTFFDPDRRCDFGTLVPSASVATIDRLDALKDQSFDLVLGINGLNRLDADGVSEICRATMPRAPVVNLQPPASLFDELACGLYSHAGVRRSLDDGLMARSLSACCSLLQAGGFEILEATSVLPGKFNWNAVIAVAPETSESLNGQVVQEKDITGAQAENATPVAAVVVGSETSPRSTALCDALCAGVDIVRTRIDNLAELVGAPSSVAVLLPPIEQDGQPNDALVRRCLLLKQVVEELKGTRCAVWVVEQLIAAVAEQQLAIKDGTCAYCRTLTNEYPNLTIRQVEICADVPVDSAAGHLTDLLTAGTQESEIVIAADGLSAMRVEPLQSNLIPLLPRATTARLERTGLPGQRVAWQAMERTAPGPGQVEIEVVATGLNFRDLMWAMDLLPEDMLENGFTGPALGLECAGRVSRVGPGVSYVAGECVVALAPSAFATHVVVDERMVAKVPDSIALEAAATVPVAFLTARYSLVTLANLHAGERVLIHGAAGAVGLAAIQIAQERGAEVIATAGSEAKRSLLRSLGVAHVFDSRSTHFVDEVLALTGDGVDVVLNSLAGAAMERSLHCVKPFGRFVELGKRDYVSNTHIGLRPFRRNLTYFGVDIDQLIEGRPDLGQDIFCSVTRLLREGRLTPLPYAVFESSRINDAFQLMQQSAHIGKIVVRPPPPDTVAAYPKPFEIDAERTHLVTGGLGGFGLATARWLVERGAKNLVLLGRSGAAGEIATSAVTAMQERGAHVTVANCDIADVEALDATLRRIRATMPPLAGIVHAAMVLEDGLIANLDRGQLERVLAPKVAGAANLDRLTREDPIEYFVLYSSITSLIGNPGQASYVAANGYLEGLARARRRQGLPGLAIGWGPIADVGIVARNSTLKESLLERRGLASMTARDALDLLGDALSVTGCDPALAALTMAPREFKGGAQRLPILRSPSFALLMGSDSPDTSPANDRLDIAALLAVEDSATVKRQVTSLIVCRLAAILHMREDEINQARPLADLGIDSLMTLELASSIESAVGMPLAVSGTMATHSISMLADQIIAQAGNIPPDGDDFKTSTLVQKHFEAVAPEHMAIVTAIAAEQKHTAEGVRN